MAKKKKQTQKRMSTNPPESVIRYSGPLVLPKKAMQAETYSVMLYQNTLVTTNGSGVCSPVVSTALSSFDETSSFQNLYDEWRLIGCTAQYIPYTDVPTASLTPGQLVLVVDRDTATNLTGLLQGLEQGGTLQNPFKKSKRVTFRMESAEEAAFTGSNSAVQVWFKMYGSSMAVTQNYGTIVTAGLWQFRGRI